LNEFPKKPRLIKEIEVNCVNGRESTYPGVCDNDDNVDNDDNDDNDDDEGDEFTDVKALESLDEEFARSLYLEEQRKLQKEFRKLKRLQREFIRQQQRQLAYINNKFNLQ